MAGGMIRSSALLETIAAQKRGESMGITSICSANPWVITSALQQTKVTGEPVLIESTCNQVNQFGGYMGKTPAQFVAYLEDLAEKQGYPFGDILLGGDHLGPSPWQNEPVASAMDKARTLVWDCVRAGYSKLHLDASMKCADDDPDQPLSRRISAARTAELAVTAETAFSKLPPGTTPPLYVIGTEVPLPGGAQEHEDTLVVTSTEDVAETIEVTREAFFERGLESAWRRVRAVVVQPGVEYGDATLFEYDRTVAAGLVRFIEGQAGLVYEAHSTDYQIAEALRQLVEDHFAILKVGPALTFAFREGVYALALIEEELLAGRRDVTLSRVRQAMDEAMLAKPVYWQQYYQGSNRQQALARKYSYSDRSRYYWPVPEVQSALSRLLQNLAGQELPLTLLSQYLPAQYARIRECQIANKPRAILLDKVERVLSDYSYACGHSPNPR